MNQNYLVELPGLFCFWYGCTRFAFVSRTLVCGLPWALDATGDNLPANVSNECNILEQVTNTTERCLPPATNTLITAARLDWSLHLLSAIRQVTHDAGVYVSLFILGNSEARSTDLAWLRWESRFLVSDDGVGILEEELLSHKVKKQLI